MFAPNTYIHQRYLIVRTIEGTVYEALDMPNRTNVALKQIALGGTTDPGIAQQFERTAQVLLALRHPGLPAVLAAFAEGDSAFIVSECIAGTHGTALPGLGQPHSVEQVLGWADQLLDTLEYLHQQAVPLIHGGIKPQNLALALDGQLKLLDLGPGPLRAQPPVARPGSPGMGSSLQFMPPEQVQGAALDQRSDLYALAATLYYLLTGELPALAGKRVNARLRGQPDPQRPAHEINPQVPPALGEVLSQALALDAEQRPASAAALRQALAHAGGRPLAESQVATWVALPGPPPSAATATAAPLAPTQPIGIATPAMAGPPTPTPAARPNWLLPAIISAIGFMLLFIVLALIVLRRMGAGPDPLAIQLITSVPAPTSQGADLPGAQGQPTTPAIEPTAPIATTEAEPTAAVPPQVSAIEPASAQVGAQPLTLSIRGTNLGQIRTARLLAEAGPPLELTVVAADDTQATLTIAGLSAPLNGEVMYALELNGEAIDAPPLALRDFIGRRQASGILPEYAYTKRVASDAVGAYTAMRAEPNAASQPIGQLRNSDELDILRDEVAGWYQVRVHRSADPAQVGSTGWIERWLIDNQDVPPQPTAVPTPAALVFVGKVYSAPTDAAAQCGSAFASSIFGSVEDTRGRGIAGARLRVTSADGRNTYTVATGKGGVYNVTGLGCTRWTVRLLSVPNAPGGVTANRVAVTNLNGGKFTAAEVRFKLQP